MRCDDDLAGEAVASEFVNKEGEGKTNWMGSIESGGSDDEADDEIENDRDDVGENRVECEHDEEAQLG